MMTRIEVCECPLDAILGMREKYRRELGVQIVHDSWHRRGLTRSYLLLRSDLPVGYGAVGGAPREARDIVKEFYLVPSERASAPSYFRALVRSSGALRIEAQTNDPLLYPMLEAFGREPSSELLLFDDAGPTAHAMPGVRFRPLPEAEHSQVFAHAHEPVGEWALERGGEVVATGGFALHYNPPFADIYMEVSGRHRRQGLGRFLVQELKRVCYEAGRVPAARCREANVGSHATLLAAGMRKCGRIVRATLAA